MPLVQTRGAASAQGFGEFAQAAVAANYIEEVFSTFLYAGTNAAITITNNIDLSTNGGLVWQKNRTSGNGNRLFTTAMALGAELTSNSTAASSNAGNLTSYSTTGFSLASAVSDAGENYVTWTFRKQPKFFDVLTYTGTGSNTTIAHALGSVPGSIIVKRTDTTAAWAVYHRSLANTQYLVLNTTAAVATGATWWNSTTPTSSVFSLGTDASVNASGGTYVAYVFAHDAGGFGLTGTDNVISCGSYTGTGAAGNDISLGYEPQWLLIKNSAGAFASVNNWTLYDVMRGFDNSADNILRANTSGAEIADTAHVVPTSTGFTLTTSGSGTNGSGSTYIYIAIRRGPMKVPTLGTDVFGMSARSGTGADATVTGGQTDDAVLVKNRGSAVASLFSSRLTGTGYLVTSTDAAEVAAGTTILQASPWDVMDGVKVGTTSTITNASANTYINYLFKRAPSVFDVVCYTGTGSGQVINHNLGVTPELLIFKARNNLNNSGYEYWYTNAPNTTYALALNLDVGESYTKISSANSTTVSLGSSNNYVLTNQTYVAYLFATCAGVSKVGSYTGNGTTQTIDCGFTGGARFVLIKRTDASGDWYTYDTARGMTVLTDPYLLLNTTAAEVATLGSVTTVSTGFALNSTILAAINVSAGTYIFLAIA